MPNAAEGAVLSTGPEFTLSAGFGVSTQLVAFDNDGFWVYEVGVNISHVSVYSTLVHVTRKELEEGGGEVTDARVRERAAHRGLHEFAQRLAAVVTSD